MDDILTKKEQSESMGQCKGERYHYSSIGYRYSITHKDIKNNIWVSVNEISSNNIDDDGKRIGMAMNSTGFMMN